MHTDALPGYEKDSKNDVLTILSAASQGLVYAPGRNHTYRVPGSKSSQQPPHNNLC